MGLSNIIIKPYKTEKTYLMALNNRKVYAFIVHKNSTKKLIAQAFDEIYNLKPLRVNVLVRKPVKIKTGTKRPGWTKLTRIAYITLPEGTDILEEEEIKEVK